MFVTRLVVCPPTSSGQKIDLVLVQLKHGNERGNEGAMGAGGGGEGRGVRGRERWGTELISS